MRRSDRRRQRTGAVLVGAIVAALLPALATAAPLSPPAQEQDREQSQEPAASRPKTGQVVDGRARFQVITPTLIRMEYAEDGRFEDRPTLTVPREGTRVPVYTTRVEGKWRVIRTERVELRWRRGSAFTPKNLVMRFDDRGSRTKVAPQPGFAHRFLGGWTRALDLSDGPEPLNNGILTREGWYVLDDSATVLLTGSGPGFAVRPQRQGAYRDWYAFAYGRDYERALRDLRTLTGSAPLLPRNAFGVWFSKYYAYSEEEFRALVARFAEERVPLDALSLDTDFKRVNDPIGSAIATLLVGQPGKPFSWNGWDWNTDLFPDPADFVDFAHDRDIALIANIHPSISGSDPQFAATDAAAGGLTSNQDCRLIQADTIGECHVFDWTDARQLKAYFDLHDRIAGTGVDGFWLDWCCEAKDAANAPGLSPDTWINAQYADYHRELGTRWPAVSRIGASYLPDGSYGDRGVGAGGTGGALAEHRSTIHFTGDTCATWEMLAFQAEHTAAESAIGMPYVSHDIGSFNGEPIAGQCQAVAAALARAPLADDLYVRWLQLGAFQPILRLHSNHGERLPWEYDGATRDAATKALRLRGQLVPYTYTAARRAVDTGLPMAGPLYLRWPNRAAAYTHPTQFTYGRDMVVAPVTTPGSSATVKAWVPPGRWVERSTGQRLRGPGLATLEAPLDRIPVLVRAGAVVPEHPSGVRAGLAPRSRLVLNAYPGARGKGRLYDDAGAGFGYERGQSTRTTFTQRRRGGEVELVVGAARGGFRGEVTRRTWVVNVLGVDRPRTVTAGGRKVKGWSYDAGTRTLRLVLRSVPSRTGVQVQVR